MAKNKRLGVSISLVLLMIFMVISIIFTFSISYMFSTEGVSGKLFGKYVYIMENDDMKPEIAKGSAVIAHDDAISVLVEGNVILFKNGSREDVMRIRQVVHNTDKTVYRVSTNASPEDTIEVPRDKVIAKCVTEGHTLGVFISFLSSLPGIILFLLVPCAVILTILVLKILSMKKNSQEDNYFPDDTEDDGYSDDFGDKFSKTLSSPLFDPEADINPSEDFERKKSSIADNFKRKPGAAPQKPPRAKNRTAPKAAVEKFKAAVEEKPHAPVSRKSSLIPENENPVRNEKLAAIKEALLKQDSPNNTERPYDADPDEEKTVSFRAVGSHTNLPPKNPRQTPPPKPSAYARSTQSAEPPRKKPSKSDNINSIDDLIKALEEEKKKL